MGFFWGSGSRNPRRVAEGQGRCGLASVRGEAVLVQLPAPPQPPEEKAASFCIKTQPFASFPIKIQPKHHCSGTRCCLYLPLTFQGCFLAHKSPLKHHLPLQAVTTETREVPSPPHSTTPVFIAFIPDLAESFGKVKDALKK